jgi:hypothetical protein
MAEMPIIGIQQVTGLEERLRGLEAGLGMLNRHMKELAEAQAEALAQRFERIEARIRTIEGVPDSQ